MSENPKVFISYSHENALFEQTVLNFANKLRSEGIDANIDLYEDAPAEGWPRWMDNQIRIADYVLVICTKSYFEKCLPGNTNGKGVSWEVNIVYQYIYDNYSETTKFIPVFFDSKDEQYILTPLKPFTYYNIGTNEGYNKLYWRLRGVSSTQKPPLGKLRPLPEKERKTMFFSSPINLELWNKAKWKGMLYLMYQYQPPILGIMYTDYSAGVQIFKDWKTDYPAKTINDNLEITYVEPPFPRNNYIYSDKDRNYGKGYWVHIGPNIDRSIERMDNIGIPLQEGLLATLCRYHWMDEINGSHYRTLFKQMYDYFKRFSLIPVTLKNHDLPMTEDNLILDMEYKIEMSNIKFVKGTDISENDVYKVVLNPPSEI